MTFYFNPYPVCDCHELRCACTPVHSFLGHYKNILEMFSPKKIFEWGPGKSTELALVHGAHVVSIESRPEWFKKISQHPNLELRLVRADSPRYSLIDANSDLFFIDADNRENCLESVFNFAKPNTIVCLHDAQRKRYQQALKKYSVVYYLSRGFAFAFK